VLIIGLRNNDDDDDGASCVPRRAFHFVLQSVLLGSLTRLILLMYSTTYRVHYKFISLNSSPVWLVACLIPNVSPDSPAAPKVPSRGGGSLLPARSFVRGSNRSSAHIDIRYPDIVRLEGARRYSGQAAPRQDRIHGTGTLRVSFPSR